jgi:phage shock protein C
MADTMTRLPALPPPPAPAPPPAPPPTWDPAPPRALRRRRDDRVVGGVCGGLADHLGVDPVVIRVAAVILALADGVGVLAYLIAWAVIPEAEERAVPPHDGPSGVAHRTTAAAVVGLALVAAGTVLLVEQVLPDAGRVLWPSLLVLLGLGIAVAGGRR